MIRHITGKYLFYEKGSIVVETQGGIGFRIHVADTSPVRMFGSEMWFNCIRICR